MSDPHQSVMLKTAFCVAFSLFTQAALADTIGGFVFVKEVSARAHASALNPGGMFASNYVGEDFVGMLSGSWHKIAFRFRGEMVANYPGHSNKASIQELYYPFPISDRWTVTVGKQVRSWDTGLSYQPLGFFRTQLEITDPFDEESRISGLPLVAVTYLGDTWNLEAVASGRTGSTRLARAVGLQWAVRLSRDFANGLNTAAVLRQHEGAPPGVGFSLSYGVGALELHADTYFRSPANLNDTALSDPNPQFFVDNPVSVRLGGPYRISSAIGFTWTPEVAISVYGEWDHKGEGLSAQQWHRYQSLIAFHTAGFGKSPLAFVNFAEDALILGTNGSRRDYSFLMISYTSGLDTTSLSTYVDMADGSAISTLSVEVPVYQNWQIVARLTAVSGSKASDFGAIPYREFGSLRLTYSF